MSISRLYLDHVISPVTQPAGVDDYALTVSVARRPVVTPPPFPGPAGIDPRPVRMDDNYWRMRCGRRRRDHAPSPRRSVRVARPGIRVRTAAVDITVWRPIDLARGRCRIIRRPAITLRPGRVTALAVTACRRASVFLRALRRRPCDGRSRCILTGTRPTRVAVPSRFVVPGIGTLYPAPVD